MTGSNIFSPPINASSQGVWDTTTAIALKALFKSVFAFFYSLSGLFHLAYFVKCWRTLVRLKPCSDLPRLGNVKKNHKKRAMHGQIQGLRFISLIHSTWWDDIPYEILFPVNCILHIWLYFSHGCRAWHRNLGLMIEKWAFRISKGDQKKIKWVYLAILFQIYTSVLNTYNATK